MTFALPADPAAGPSRSWQTLREGDDPGDGKPGTRPEDDLTTRARRAVLCRSCRLEIGDPAAIFTMNPGRRTEVFMNPHGYLHEILTLRRGRNLLVLGPPTTEFTWFPGYAWQIALCASCRSHLGWFFTAVEARDLESFWGLRRQAVVVGGSE